MKVEVTEKGVYDAKGQRVDVGTSITFKGDEIPAYLVGKCRVASAPKAKAAAVTNPAKAPVKEPQDD